MDLAFPEIGRIKGRRRDPRIEAENGAEDEVDDDEQQQDWNHLLPEVV